MALKHGNHIADVKTVVVSGDKATGIDFTLWAGDTDGDDDVSTVAATTPSDPEGDNDVDLIDYFILYYQHHGGLPVTAGCNGDFDGDKDVDFYDYYGMYYGYQNAADPGNWY